VGRGGEALKAHTEHTRAHTHAYTRTYIPIHVHIQSIHAHLTTVVSWTTHHTHIPHTHTLHAHTHTHTDLLSDACMIAIRFCVPPFTTYTLFSLSTLLSLSRSRSLSLSLMYPPSSIHMLCISLCVRVYTYIRIHARTVSVNKFLRAFKFPRNSTVLILVLNLEGKLGSHADRDMTVFNVCEETIVTKDSPPGL